MAAKKMSNYNLSVIYCDDVRHEIDGKVTLVGCYNTKYLVEAFPVQIRQLVAHFTLDSKVDNPLQSGKYKVKVLINDEAIIDVEGDPEIDTITSSEHTGPRFTGGILLEAINISEEAVITFQITPPNGEPLKATPFLITTRKAD